MFPSVAEHNVVINIILSVYFFLLKTGGMRTLSRETRPSN